MKTSVKIKERLEMKKVQRNEQQRRRRKKKNGNVSKQEKGTNRLDHIDKRHRSDITKAALRKRKQRENEEKIKLARLKRVEQQQKRRARKRMGYLGDVSDSRYVFNNRMQKSRAVSKVRSSLPKKTPVRVATLSAYLKQHKSPTIQALHRSGVVLSPEEKETMEIGDALLKDVKACIEDVKIKRSDDCRVAMNVISASVSGESIAKSKSKCKLAARLGVTKRRIFRANRQNKIYHTRKAAFTFTKRKTRSDAITDEVKHTAFEFWCNQENSRPTGNKADVKRVRLAPNVYSSHAVYILEKTQTEVFMDFQKKYPHIKISLRMFEHYKPYFVRPVRVKDRITCCCRYHVEARSLHRACMNFRKSLQDIDPVIYPALSSLSDTIAATLCNKDEERQLYKKNCLERNCDHCGVNLLKFHQNEMTNQEDAPDVNWECYEYVNINCKAGTKRKLMLMQKVTKPGEMFDYFKKIMHSFPEHQQKAAWQNQQLKHLIQNLSLNNCICVHDFSENYRCIDRTEVQYSYFQKTEASIHVTLIYRHAVLEVDGTVSTEDEPVVVGEQMFLISPDEKHDRHFVRVAQEYVESYLKDLNYSCTVMHEFCDGCSSQYKSCHCLGYLTDTVETLGYDTMYRNFFETSHAKGPQDAAGGLLKNQADLAVTRGQAKIQNAYDLFKYANNFLKQTKSKRFTRRIFNYVEEIKRTNSQMFKPIPENRKIHQVKCSPNSRTLQVRASTCYTCENCLDGNNDSCEYNDFVGRIKDVEIKTIDSGTNIESENEEPPRIQLCDFITNGAIVAVLSCDENEEFYMFQCNQKLTLPRKQNDAWGATYGPGAEVLKGLYFNKINELKYSLITRKCAFVPQKSVLYLCNESELNGNVLLLSDEEIQNITECVESSKIA